MSGEDLARGWDECNAQWAARGLTPDFANPYGTTPTEDALNRLTDALVEWGDDVKTFDVVVELLAEAWDAGRLACRSKHLSYTDSAGNPFDHVVRANGKRVRP